MNEVETPKKSLSLRHRLLWVVGVPALAFLIVALAVYGHGETRSANRLAAIVEKLDETDPGWRLEEIEAARVRLKDADNSAALCRELVPLLGPGWPKPEVDDKLRDGPLGELPDRLQQMILEDEMARLLPVRNLARKMVLLPKGRHKLEYRANPYDSLVPDQQDVRKLGRLFDYEMRHRANQGDVSEAVRAGRGCVCAARSVYDEPTFTSQLIRFAVVTLGLRGVERSLALGESNDAELAALDSLLAEEGRQNLYLLAMRGDRAMTYRLYERIASGELSPDLIVTEEEGFGRSFSNPRRTVRHRWPGTLDAMSRAVDIARLPSHEQATAEKAIVGELDGERDPAALHLLTLDKVGLACRRTTAWVSAMRGLIAVERYRMKHTKWPARLADVVPEFLKEVPTDPFDGKPLRMARVAEGVVVYSVGPDRMDDGGKLDRAQPAAPGTDLGFQALDKPKRRRPPSSTRPAEKQP